MAVRRGGWLFLTLAIVLLLYIRDLLGQTHGGGEVVKGTRACASLRVRRGVLCGKVRVLCTWVCEL